MWPCLAGCIFTSSYSKSTTSEFCFHHGLNIVRRTDIYTLSISTFRCSLWWWCDVCTIWLDTSSSVILSWYLALPVSCYQQSWLQFGHVYGRLRHQRRLWWVCLQPGCVLLWECTLLGFYQIQKRKRWCWVCIQSPTSSPTASPTRVSSLILHIVCMYVCMYVHPYSRFNTGQQHAVVCFRESLVKEFYPCLAVDAYVHGCVDLMVL